MAKKGQVFKKYSLEFKLSVILDMRESYLGYRETVRKFWHTNNIKEEDLYVLTVKRWKRKYLEEGYEGLMKDNRERPPKLDKKVEEDLIAENQRLKSKLLANERNA